MEDCWSEMTNFVSNVRNPYASKEKDTKRKIKAEQFVSTSKAGAAPMFRNRTASIQEEK